MNHNEKTPAVNLPRSIRNLLDNIMPLEGTSKIAENTAEIFNYLNTSETFNNEDFKRKEELSYQLTVFNRLALMLVRHQNGEFDLEEKELE